MFTLRTVTNGIIELRWMEMLHGNTKQLHYLVMLKTEVMPFDNYKEKKNYFRVDIFLAASHHFST